jgi:hypothetical protein
MTMTTLGSRESITGHQDTPQQANGPVARHPHTLSAYLTAVPPSGNSSREDYYLYDLALDGEVIVTGSRTPEFDACRILVARGLTGKLVIFDANTRKPRLTVDIKAGAKLTVKESRKQSPTFAKWAPFDRTYLDRREPEKGIAA